MGRDWLPRNCTTRANNFNPLSPCGERLFCLLTISHRFVFQPTLPVWGETPPDKPQAIDAIISTHSPRVGRDAGNARPGHKPRRFQPTLPVWGETKCVCVVYFHSCISTHSPRVGRDPPPEKPQAINAIISTHSPRVGRDGQHFIDIKSY